MAAECVSHLGNWGESSVFTLLFRAVFTRQHLHGTLDPRVCRVSRHWTVFYFHGNEREIFRMKSTCADVQVKRGNHEVTDEATKKCETKEGGIFSCLTSFSCRHVVAVVQRTFTHSLASDKKKVKIFSLENSFELGRLVQGWSRWADGNQINKKPHPDCNLMQKYFPSHFHLHFQKLLFTCRTVAERNVTCSCIDVAKFQLNTHDPFVCSLTICVMIGSS